MATITPPKYVRQVLVTLQGRGYPAFLVGGCVRDMVLGVQPHDWDICTAALPEQVLGMRFGPWLLAVGLTAAFVFYDIAFSGLITWFGRTVLPRLH